MGADGKREQRDVWEAEINRVAGEIAFEAA
jgi:hypothetical protein